MFNVRVCASFTLPDDVQRVHNSFRYPERILAFFFLWGTYNNVGADETRQTLSHPNPLLLLIFFGEVVFRFVPRLAVQLDFLQLLALEGIFFSPKKFSVRNKIHVFTR